jgi:archaellum component FlaC
VTQPPDPEARLARLEARVEEVAADAAAARHLAAAHDRDIADVGVKVNACRGGVEGRLGGVEGRLGGVEGRLGGVEGRLDGLEQRVDVLETKVDEGFAQMHRGFAQMRHGFDQTAAGFARIATLIEGLEPR